MNKITQEDMVSAEPLSSGPRDVLTEILRQGAQKLIALADGYRESTQSWRELLLEVKSRGLSQAAKLATGDGALGFWAALREIYPGTQQQRGGPMAA